MFHPSIIIFSQKSNNFVQQLDQKLEGVPGTCHLITT